MEINENHLMDLRLNLYELLYILLPLIDPLSPHTDDTVLTEVLSSTAANVPIREINIKEIHQDLEKLSKW